MTKMTLEQAARKRGDNYDLENILDLTCDCVTGANGEIPGVYSPVCFRCEAIGRVQKWADENGIEIVSGVEPLDPDDCLESRCEMEGRYLDESPHAARLVLSAVNRVDFGYVEDWLHKSRRDQGKSGSVTPSMVLSEALKLAGEHLRGEI